MRFTVSLGLLFLAQILTLWGAPILLTGDQKTYLAIATEMHERGSWLIPYLFGEANYLKPPLQLWATLLSWKFFGFSLAAAILPSILAWVASAALFRQTLIKLAYSERVADVAGLLLMGTFGAMTYGTTVQMDVWILFFWMLIPFLALRAAERPVFLRFLSVWFTAGLLAWVKGPLYSVLMGLSLLYFLRKHLKSISQWCAILIGICVGAAWFAALYFHDPDAFLRFLFVENGEKMGGNQSSIFDLWGAFFAALLPVGLLIPISLKRTPLFFIVFFSPIALFFSFFPYRVGSYLFPLTGPALVLIASRLVERPLSKPVILITSLLAFALASFSLFLFSADFIGMPTACSVVVLVLTCTLFLQRFRPMSTAIILGLLMATTRSALVEIGNPEYIPLKHVSQFNPDRTLMIWVPEKHWWHEFGWLSAIAGRAIQAPLGGDLGAHLLHSPDAIWILTDEEHSKMAAHFGQNECTPWVRIAKRGMLPKTLIGWMDLKRSSKSLQRIQFFCSKKEFRFL